MKIFKSTVKIARLWRSVLGMLWERLKDSVNILHIQFLSYEHFMAIFSTQCVPWKCSFCFPACGDPPVCYELNPNCNGGFTASATLTSAPSTGFSHCSGKTNLFFNKYSLRSASWSKEASTYRVSSYTRFTSSVDNRVSHSKAPFSQVTTCQLARFQWPAQTWG